jgi:hypothetical protein
LACAGAAFYLFIYNILIFISLQANFIPPVKKIWAKSENELRPSQRAFGGNFSKLSPEKKIRGKIKS